MLKTSFEPEWFHNDEITTLYSILGPMHDRHMAFMQAMPFVDLALACAS